MTDYRGLRTQENRRSAISSAFQRRVPTLAQPREADQYFLFGSDQTDI